MPFNVSLVTKYVDNAGPYPSERFYAAAAKRCSEIALQKGEAPTDVTELQINSICLDPYEPYLPQEVETRFTQGDRIIADENIDGIQSAFEQHLKKLGLSSTDIDSAIARIHIWDEKGNCWKQPDRNFIETEY